MPIPTEPIGSIPRPQELIEAQEAFASGDLFADELREIRMEAIRDTIERFQETGSPVVTDGEQGKPSFATYPIAGSDRVEPGGVSVKFEDGHSRQLPLLTEGPFGYETYAVEYLKTAQELADVPVKQAVIAPSMLAMIYPEDGLEDYPRSAFLNDLVDEATEDVSRCLDVGAYRVQMDFTEGRLAVKLDPSKDLLRSFVGLNNRVLDRFSLEQRGRIGVHTCPGGDRDSTHSADVDYAELLPLLFELHADNFYMQLASEADRAAVLEVVREHSKRHQRIFVGVIDPIDPEVESPETVRDRVLEAAEYIPVDRLGTTDDCGFSPFGDDTSTARDTAFAKIRARIEGTRLAEKELGV